MNGIVGRFERIELVMTDVHYRSSFTFLSLSVQNERLLYFGPAIGVEEQTLRRLRDLVGESSESRTANESRDGQTISICCLLEAFESSSAFVKCKVSCGTSSLRISKVGFNFHLTLSEIASSYAEANM